MGSAIEPVAMLGGMRVHRHAAHRVFDALIRMLVHTLLGVVHMCVRFMNCHGGRPPSSGPTRMLV